MWINALLLAVLSICVVTDIRSRKIYNNVILPVFVLAVVFQTATSGWDGALHALAGLAVGFAILFIPYMLGGMGAGDVKLLALVGALKGVGFVLVASFYMALVGALMALLIVLFKKGFRERVRFVQYVAVCIRFRLKLPLQGAFTSGTYPYGVAIAGGCLFGLMLKGWGAG
ncbi:prepilin peptidase CpaA [Paenibacillus phyllosphaerae]|uniref:Prepilin peptidase CpaA n=1 Tax=Paenibacillus phyllosphaerae TaxID=274593 RepID=A0A7W5B403_9BACL|nr:prepilin peptidase [Paenibacillus phyllosphaerae]MBB3113822.1 prepilin peptidase CpaA [Paenibacillus phyllosphaerae]